MNETASWQIDKLGRQEESLFLTNYVISRYQQDSADAAFVLNVSADRGMGKSYFLHNWALDLKASNHPVVEFNAWETDFSGEPLLALLSDLRLQLSQILGKAPKAMQMLYHAIGQGKNLIKPSEPVLTSLLTNTLTGLSREKLGQLMELESRMQGAAGGADEAEYQDMLSSIMPAAAEQALKNHRARKESIAEFRHGFTALLAHMDKEMKSVELPLFILVDELDRCRPEYAVELLEKIRQLFALHGVVFVVAADAVQLSYSIRSVYGRTADASRYLKQFFDQQYKLIEPRKYQYVEYLFHKHKLDQEARFFTPLSVKFSVTRNVHMDLFAIAAKFFRLNLSEQDQVCAKLKAVCLTWTLEKKIHLLYMLFLLMLQQKEPELAEQYFKGSNLAERVAVLKQVAYHALVDESVVIRTNIATTDRIHTPEKREPFAGVVEKYVEYANQAQPQIAAAGGSALEVYRDIREQLTHGMPEQYNPEAPPRHELWRYHDMIRRVGHLVQN